MKVTFSCNPDEGAKLKKVVAISEYIGYILIFLIYSLIIATILTNI